MAQNLDKEKWGGHYDILPTLAPFAFSAGVRYLNIGVNLIKSDSVQAKTYSYNTEKILSEESFKEEAHRKARARECLLLLNATRFMRDTSLK